MLLVSTKMVVLELFKCKNDFRIKVAVFNSCFGAFIEWVEWRLNWSFEGVDWRKHIDLTGQRNPQSETGISMTQL